MQTIHEAFKKIQEIAISQGISASLVHRDQRGIPIDLSDAKLVFHEPKNHPTLFDVNYDLNLYKYDGSETAYIVAKNESEAMAHLVKFVGDEIKDDGGIVAIIPSEQIVEMRDENFVLESKRAAEWVSGGEEGVLASSLY